MEYPTDLLLTEDMDIRLDASNDLATISGQRQLEQSVVLDVFDVLQDFVGERLTGQAVGRLEERVMDALQRDEQLSEIQTVDLREYNKESGTVTMYITVVGDEDFSLELST